MLMVDQAIFDANRVICRNIAVFDDSERGLLSQNILSQLRNFVEYIAQKAYSNGADTDPNDYENKKAAWEFVKTQGQLRFLSKFHGLLQKSVSHYTFDEGSSERLMLKYYEYLLKIKDFLKRTYSMDVLENINDFPLNLDTNLMDYYRRIAERIIKPSSTATGNPYHDRAYIQKIKPFFVEHRIFYEVTFTIANDKASKFDRVIAFTRAEISDNYAVKLSMHNDCINVLGKSMPIQVIDDWEISIRPCEINRFANIFGSHDRINTSNVEFRELMLFLTKNCCSLVDLVTASDSYYTWARKICTQRAKAIFVFDLLDRARELIHNNAPGSNVVRYLLHKMNNKIMKWQFCRESCNKLSGLYLKWGCIPFDVMPFTTALVNHNPRLYDLFECISPLGREHEFLARAIRNNTEKNGVLFTPISELNGFENIEKLQEAYNSKIYPKHTNRYLRVYKEHLYIEEFASDTAEIIRRLKVLSSRGMSGYESFVESWLAKNPSYRIDSAEKLDALKTAFADSHVAFIYGSAGTGKSTLINHISNLYNERNKIYIANTHPAVDNMRRKVNAGNCTFKTIRAFLSTSNNHTDCDILFIDECSTVSNRDMRAILDKATFKLLVLVGDVFQIESILYGNWFSIARDFVPKTSVIELTKPYRSTNKQLLTIWDRVRKLDDAILEPMVKGKYTVNLDDSIFEHSEDDEIILCLNYDGLYGINNINRFLQTSNSNPPISWGINVYKIGDPILFTESERFNPLIYNNMKGVIRGIEVEGKRIWFAVELDIAITEWEAEGYDFTLLGNSDTGNSIIGFWTDKYRSTDDDDDSAQAVIPFQVAYAVSIHKAQGLEYKSVKIVITSEVEELITHNIFYTAITRAKEKLKIYWSPETEKKVLEGLSLRNYHKDAALLAALKSI